MSKPKQRNSRATQILLIAYATAVWLVACYPWNVVLLALIAGRRTRPELPESH